MSGQFRKCHIPSDLLQECTPGPLLGEWSLKTARDYYPSSPLLFVLVQCVAAALGMFSLSLGCITNNGLTYVPLINTSAD